MNILFENIALNGGFPSLRLQDNPIFDIMKGAGMGNMGSLDELVDYFYGTLIPELKNERNKTHIRNQLEEEMQRGNFPDMNFSEEDLVDLNNLISVQGQRINTEVEKALSQSPNTKGLSLGDTVRMKRDIIEKADTGQEAFEDEYQAGIY